MKHSNIFLYTSFIRPTRTVSITHTYSHHCCKLQRGRAQGRPLQLRQRTVFLFALRTVCNIWCTAVREQRHLSHRKLRTPCNQKSRQQCGLLFGIAHSSTETWPSNATRESRISHNKAGFPTGIGLTSRLHSSGKSSNYLYGTLQRRIGKNHQSCIKSLPINDPSYIQYSKVNYFT